MKLRAQKEKSGPDPRIKRCMDRFHVAHLERHGFKPLLGAKAGSLFKALLNTWSEEDVFALIDLFFSTTDPRVVRSDYSVGAFYALAAHLQLLRRGRSASSGVEDHNAHSARQAAQRRGDA